MLEYAPPTTVRLKPDAPVSQWGCKPDMMQAGFEHSCLGNIRFTAKGAREIACCHSQHIMKLADALAEKAGKAPPTFSDKSTVLDLIESTCLNNMGDQGLGIADKLGLRAWRGSAGPGSIVFIPTAFAVVERALGADVVFGFRTHVVENIDVAASFAELENKMLAHTDADKSSVLKTFAAVRKGVAAHVDHLKHSEAEVQVKVEPSTAPPGEATTQSALPPSEPVAEAAAAASASAPPAAPLKTQTGKSSAAAKSAAAKGKSR